MPKDQSEFGDLLALLAQLQKRLLAGLLLEKIGNPCENSAILLGHSIHHARVLIVRRVVRNGG